MLIWRRVAMFWRRLVEQGVQANLDDGLNKRIRLTNGLSLFAAALMLASVPWDLLQSPPWLVVEDIVGGAVFTALEEDELQAISRQQVAAARSNFFMCWLGLITFPVIW